MEKGSVPLIFLLIAVQAPAQPSGLDPASFDRSVRPQDDLFRHVNGRWLATADIPPDRVSYGTFSELAENNETALRALIEEAADAPRRRAGSPLQQIGDLYTSHMDRARIEALGATPISAALARINGILTPRDLAAEIGHFSALAAGGPFGAMLLVDARDSARLIVQISQGGILLPDRDYYVKDDAAFAEVRSKYEAYLARIFRLIGQSDPAAAARSVLDLDTALARILLPVVESREAARTAKPATLAELGHGFPGFDWMAWARPQGIHLASSVTLQQPAFFRSFGALVPATPLDTWKAWLAARHVTAMAPYLSQSFVDARFDFFGRELTGQALPRERWKSGVSLVSALLGDALGRMYVEKHFPPRAKARAERLLATVVKAYREAIGDADWLSRETKSEAAAKLARLTSKIGFPERWRDYRALEIRPDDFFGNVQRARRFDSAFRTARAGGPLEQGEWLVTAQTINAYYNPGLNEIVLPAALLQPPVFGVDADDAVNYGALGAMVGHELGHAFDERGRSYDAGGTVRHWWTPDEEREYRRRADALVKQFDAYSPLQGGRVNGQLTLAENLGDLSGLSVAHRAYRMSLGSQPAPVIDGFTGDQRFFLSWARVWRAKIRPDYLRQWLLVFQHAPFEYRANGPVSNLQAYYDAFALTPDDKLFRRPDQRLKIW